MVAKMTSSFTNENVKRFDFQTVRTIAIKKAEELKVAQMPPPPPTFSEAELQAEFQKGFSEGKREGIAETQKANTELENRTNEALNLLAIQLTNLKEAAEAQTGRYKAQVANLALMLAKKVAGSALKEDPSAKVMECVEKALPLLMEQATITIQVNPAVATMVEEKTRKMCTEKNITSPLQFVSSAETPLTDCKLEWKGGGAEYQSAEQWAQIEKLLEEIVK
ncbi:MAG: hypothetical protein EB060_08025 [Proteobacteria bacterium]|nr:hypothetical protein [Pseudomonadota bacterium]